MSKPKEYNIDSFDKLINVANSNNIQNLASDLVGWLMFSEKIISQMREQYPEETKGKKNSELMKCSFIWVDDSKTDFIGVNIENRTTGEVSEIRFDVE